MQWCTEKHQLSEKQSSWGELECWLRQGICRNQEGSHNQSDTWICWFFPSFHIRNWCKLTGIRCCSYAGSRNGRRIIAYASRTFHGSERNDAKYSSAKLGLLAVKWVVTEKFKDNLYGAKFEILTDNNPLCYLQSTSKLGTVEQRWAAQLAIYNFEIKYRTGKTNQAADALSRLPRQGTEITAKVSMIMLEQAMQTSNEHSNMTVDCNAIYTLPKYSTEDIQSMQ